MLSIFSGAALFVIGIVALWWFAPNKGVVHPMVLKPFFATALTIIVMGALAVGVALVVDGLVG